MCGIFGIVEKRGHRVDPQALERGTNALRHRGPDGSGLYAEGRVGLGHRRLSIIDLEGGDQPIFNEDGRICVVFNGEIYNYIELREELIAAGHVFTTQSDTEVIVHGYEEWGTECLHRFRGMFAIALWDSNEGTLLLARDRLGKKPLYYYHGGGRLVFASELKAIVQDPAIPKDLDLDGVEQYLTWKVVPGNASILKGIEKLPPGHFLIWKNDSTTTRQYWDVSFAPDTTIKTEDEWAERVEASLREAVRLRLRSDVPLGIFLSGGLDSSGIVALASQELGGTVSTYSVGFDEREFSELPYAKLVADRYGTEHTEILVQDRSIDVLEELAYHLDEPFGDASALPTYYVCREARKHVTVCLSGDGGDEFFAGYSRYRHGLAAARRYDWMPASARTALSRAASAFYSDRWKGWGEIQRFGYASPGVRYEAMMSAFTPAERETLLNGKASNSKRDPLPF